MRTLNAGRSTVRLGIFSVLLGAIVLLGWAAGAVAQTQEPFRFASDETAGYVVFPKIIVHTTGVIPPNVPPPDGVSVDSLIQLTNTNNAEQVTVNCWYVNTLGECGGQGGRACRENSDCPGVPPQLCQPRWASRDFQVTLTPNQPLAWSAAAGLLQIPCDDTFPGPGCPSDPASGSIPPTEDPFLGELKCVQVEVTDEPEGDEIPVAANDLKGEATIIYVQDPSLDPPPRLASAAYNAIGFQANNLAAPSGDPEDPLCLGDLPAGTDGDLECAMEYAPCPGILILDHFFEGAEPSDTFGGVVNTELTLAPCSENLGITVSSGDDFSILPTVVAQMLIYNEYEQRFSASTRVQCYRNIRLSDIDTRPGPNDDPFSVFSVGVQGTETGQTRIRGVRGPAAANGYGLVGLAQEFYSNPNAAGACFEASSAFNVHHTGFRAEGDAVYRTITP